MIAFRIRSGSRVSFGYRAGDFLGDWTLAARPVQSVLFAWRTGDPGGILQHAFPFPFGRRVDFLRFDIAAADFDRIEFITADTAKQQFLPTRLGVEVPLGAGLYEGQRKGPVFIADHHGGAVEQAGDGGDRRRSGMRAGARELGRQG